MIFQKKTLLVDVIVKAKYLFLDIKLLHVRQSREPVRRCVRLGDDFDWLGVR